MSFCGHLVSHCGCRHPWVHFWLPALDMHPHTRYDSAVADTYGDWLMGRVIMRRAFRGRGKQTRLHDVRTQVFQTCKESASAISEESAERTQPCTVGSQMLVLFRVSGLNLSEALVTVECFKAEKWEKSSVCLLPQRKSCRDRDHDMTVSLFNL